MDAKHRPKLLHLCSNRWNSAIAEYVVSSTRCLAQDFEQQAIVLQDSPLAVRLSAQVKTRELKNFAPWRAAQVAVLAKRFRPDAIIAYGGPELTLAASVQVVAGAKKILRFFGDASRVFKAPSLPSQLLINSSCQDLILPSKDLARQWQSFFPKLNVHGITLGLSPQKFRALEEIARQPRPTLLIFGRLDPIKGHYQAMATFSELLKIWPEGMPRPLLKIVGKAANLSHVQLHEHADVLHLAKSDYELDDGHIDNVTALLNKAHVGWIPSLGSEIICRVTQEFLLSGTAVVTSDAGTLRECVFAEAGSSYPVTAPAADVAAQTLKPLLMSAFAESFASRQQRADQARLLFSDARMREQLLSILGDP